MTIDKHFESIALIVADIDRIYRNQRDLFSCGIDFMTIDQLQSCNFLLTHEIRQIRLMVQDLQEAHERIKQ